MFRGQTCSLRGTHFHAGVEGGGSEGDAWCKGGAVCATGLRMCVSPAIQVCLGGKGTLWARTFSFNRASLMGLDLATGKGGLEALVSDMIEPAFDRD